MSRHTVWRLLCALGLALGMHGLGWLITQPTAERWLLAHRWWRLDDLWMALHLGPLLAAGGLDHWNERLFVGAAWLQWLLIGYGMGLCAAPEVNSGAATKRGATAPRAPRTQTRRPE